MRRRMSHDWVRGVPTPKLEYGSRAPRTLSCDFGPHMSHDAPPRRYLLGVCVCACVRVEGSTTSTICQRPTSPTDRCRGHGLTFLCAWPHHMCAWAKLKGGAWKESPWALFFRLFVKGRHLRLTAAEVIASRGLNAVTDQPSVRQGGPRDQSPARPPPDTLENA